MAQELIKTCKDAKYLIEIGERHSENIASFLNGLINGSESSSTSIRSDEVKNVRKRKDGRWEYRASTESGRISFYAHTLRQIVEKIKKLKLDQPKQVLQVSYKIKKPSVIEYAWSWFKNYKEPFVSRSSQDMYKSCFKYLEKLTMPIDEAKTLDLQMVINSIAKPRIKDYSVLLIKQVFRKALSEDLIRKDVSQFIEKGKTIENKGRSLTLDEQKLVLNNLERSRIGKLILFYLLTGCRRSEAALIQKKDINFNKNVIEVKGTKTKSSQRYVLISEKLKLLLQENFDEMFAITSNNISKLFKKFTNLLGLSDITVHSLRHTYSTNLYYLGVPDKLRQAQLGHASIVMTNDIYTHLDPTITREDIVQLYGDWYPNYK